MKFIKFILIFILLFQTTLFAYDFIIENYNVNIILLKNSSAQIEEKILVNFLEPRRGIIRFIPYRYKKGFFNNNLRIKIISVESSVDGEHFYKEHYEIYKRGRNFFVKIGEYNKYYKGLKYYKIIYVVKNAIKFYNKYSEFYWNVIGTNWDTIIKSAYFRIDFPEVDREKLKVKIFIGKFGETQELKDFELTNSDVSLLYPLELPPKNGLTIGITFPKKLFSPIPSFIRWYWFLVDNFGYFIPIIILIIMFFIWLKIGKDEKKGTIVVRYYPPKDLTPAEVGTIIDDKVDLRDIISTILHLGEKGYLKIFKREDGEVEFIKNEDKSPDNLKPHEKIIYNGLFGLSDKISIKALKGYFHITIERAKDALYDLLTNKEKYFSINPEEIRNLFKTAGLITIFAGIFIFFYSLTFSRIDIGIGIIISGFIILFFSRLMPHRTFEGAKVYREILGYKEFLEKVEKPVIEKLIKEDPLYFSKNLPFAVALNIEKKWIKKFEGIDVKLPEWYIAGASTHYTPIVFYSLLSDDLNSMERMMSFKPTGESSFETINSTGGDFSIGGGFSGGGFGGGGGTTW